VPAAGAPALGALSLATHGAPGLPYRHPLFPLRLFARLRLLEELAGLRAGGAFQATRLAVQRALRRGLCALFDLYPVARLQLALHRAEQPIFEEAAQLLERLELFAGGS
jgi:hypothetical protein